MLVHSLHTHTHTHTHNTHKLPYFCPSGGPPGAWLGAGGRLTGSHIPGGPGGGRGGGDGGKGGSGPLKKMMLSSSV